MATLQLGDMPQVVAFTQRHFERDRWVNLLFALQKYIAMPKLFGGFDRRRARAKDVKHSEHVAKETVRGGWEIEFDLIHGTAGTAKNKGRYEVDTLVVGSAQTKARIPFRGAESHFAYDEEEIMANTDKERIISLLKVKRIASMADMAILMEENLWGRPADANDNKTPHGIGYWFAGSNTTGFYGNLPYFEDGTQPSTIAGVTPTTGTSTSGDDFYSNYTDQYADVIDTDLIEKLRMAMDDTEFVSPIASPDLDEGDSFAMYTRRSVILDIRKLMRLQNDSLGTDLDFGANRERIRGVTIEYVPYFEANNSRYEIGYRNPIFGINWAVMKAFVRAGMDMKERKPMRAPNQRTVTVVYTDISYNFVNENRRRGFRIATDYDAN